MIRGREEVWVVQPGRYVIVDVDWKRKKRMYRVAFWCVEISDCWEYDDDTRCRVGYAKLLERKQDVPDIHEDDIQKAVLMCREKEEVR
jgi:ferredoxin